MPTSSVAAIRPVLGRRPRPGAARFLFICWYDPYGVATVRENIAMWQQLSEFELSILNLWPSRGHPLVLPATVDLAEFDGIIIHAAVAYSFDNLNALELQLDRPFEHYDGVKVLAKQDEQCTTGRFAEYLGRKQFDVLLTCVPEAELPRVYPREQVGEVAFVPVLTGYVTPTMREMATPWSRSRPIDIGYRGSIQPLAFGRLGFEKRKIGYDVAAALAGRDGLFADISSRPQDRFYGTAWIDFMTGSKATLGVESGSNLFDFDGTVEEWCRRFEAAHPQMDRLSEKFYCLADREYLCRFEGNVDYAQVSPRHFEAAAARSLQILYEGRYSGIFSPGAHFLPLARDLSNLDEVLEALSDDWRCTEITERSFAEIICNPSHGYEAFVAKVDRSLDSALQRKRGTQRPTATLSRAMPRCLILCAADPVEEPRIEMLAAWFARNHQLCEIGTHKTGIDGGGPTLERLSDSRSRIRVEQSRHEAWWMPRPDEAGRALSLGRRQFLYLAVMAEASEPQLRSFAGALDALPEDVAQFRKEARDVLNCGSALFEAAQRTGRFDLVVATDFASLLAAVALRGETRAALVLDARAPWPEPKPGARHWRIDFWTEFARDLLAEADLAIAASPQLAGLMAAEYARDFAVLAGTCLDETFDRLSLRIRAAENSRKDDAEAGAFDLSWVEDPRAMRSPAPAEVGNSRLLKAYAGQIVQLYNDNPRQAEMETARVLHAYAAEIVRLNEYFPAEIARLHQVYPAEIATLKTEIARLHQIYEDEIARLNAELHRLRQVIGSYWGVRLYRLCRRSGAGILRTLHKAREIRS
jgi:hypothetical protein